MREENKVGDREWEDLAQGNDQHNVFMRKTSMQLSREENLRWVYHVSKYIGINAFIRVIIHERTNFAFNDLQKASAMN